MFKELLSPEMVFHLKNKTRPGWSCYVSFLAMSYFHTKQIYLDHNATTPLYPELLDKIPMWLKEWGNPSSIHWASRGPKSLIRESRHALADLIGVQPLEIVFTSGGSEGNNFLLKGLYSKIHQKRNEFIISCVEHPSVKTTMSFLKSQGAQVYELPVTRQGLIDLEKYEFLLSEKTACVSVMLVNNETGQVFPLKKMIKKAHQVGAYFHTDAVQALGRFPIDMKALDVDCATFSGHKFYALKGSGFVYIKKGFPLESLIHGGTQERSRRAGTENVLALASLGFMAQKKDMIVSQYERLSQLSQEMEKRILNEISGTHLTGAEGKRVGMTSSFVIEGVDGEVLMMNLDLKGFAISTGAACSSGSSEPSPALIAMGLTPEEAQSSLRIGLGWMTQAEEVHHFVDELKLSVEHLRNLGRKL